MIDKEKITIKQELLSLCFEQVNEKLRRVDLAMSEAQESANNESKSSAGDKHETGRAMAQLEKEKMLKQRAEILNLKRTLDLINVKDAFSKAALGSVVKADSGNYFLSTAIGLLEVNSEKYFAISLVSPIGQLLLNKSASETVNFNGKNILINQVY